MDRLILLWILALATACTSGLAPPKSTQVMVIAAMHSAHKGHPSYSYDHLFDAVSAFKPDIVAVEMREEDLSRDPSYLARNYPSEMLELTRQYEPNVRGFDWLGKELEGMPVPDEWWQTRSWVKRLERELRKDSSVQTPRTNALQKQQVEMIKFATAESLNDGSYDGVTRAYYRALGEELAGSRYAPLTKFYRERDRQIANNIDEIVRENRGRRIAVVLGADHRAPVIDRLQERSRNVKIVAVVPVRSRQTQP